MAAAGAEWNAAKRGRRVAAPGREVDVPAPETWRGYAAEMDQLREQLRSVPITDRDTWSRLARRTSGALAAWSDAVEKTPGAMARASDALSRSAQTMRRETSPTEPQMVAVSGGAMLVASAAKGGVGAVGQAALMRSLMNLSRAVHDAAHAQAQYRQADAIATQMRGRLGEVYQRLDAAAAKQQPAPGPETAPGTPAGAEVSERMRVTLALAQAGQARPATEATRAATKHHTPAVRTRTERGQEREGRE